MARTKQCARKQPKGSKNSEKVISPLNEFYSCVDALRRIGSNIGKATFSFSEGNDTKDVVCSAVIMFNDNILSAISSCVRDKRNAKEDCCLQLLRYYGCDNILLVIFHIYL
jgi:hypothetical protein